MGRASLHVPTPCLKPYSSFSLATSSANPELASPSQKAMQLPQGSSTDMTLRVPATDYVLVCLPSYSRLLEGRIRSQGLRRAYAKQEPSK